MSTSQSPIAKLQAEADRCAAMLKAAERGDPLPGVPFAAKLSEARASKPTIKFAVFQDDKVINLEMAWELIAEQSEAQIAAIILKYMRGNVDAAH